MENEWAEFLKEFPYPTRFLHRDEWEQEFQRRDALPAVFLKVGENISLWILPEDLDSFSLDQLQAHITEKVKTLKHEGR